MPHRGFGHYVAGKLIRMAGRIEIAVVVAVPFTLAATVVLEASSVRSDPVRLARATDIPARAVPMVEADVTIADIVDRVSVRIHQWTAAASRQ